MMQYRRADLYRPAALIVLALILCGTALLRRPPASLADSVKRYKPELVVQSGHESNVTFLMFSPDGRYILSGDGRTTKLWDPATGLELRTLKERNTDYRIDYSNISFSADSRYLIEGLTLTDLYTGQLVRTFPAPAPVIGAYESFLSRDGKLFASAWRQNANVWNGRTGELQRWFEIHLATINSNKSLLAGYGRLAPQRTAPPDPNADIPQDEVVPALDDHAVHIFSLETGSEVARLDGFPMSPYAIRFSPDGSRVITVEKEQIRVWDIASQKVLDSIANALHPIDENGIVGISPIGDALVFRGIGSDDRVTPYFLWPVGSGVATEIARPTLSWAGGSRPSMAFDPTGRTLAFSEATNKTGSNFRASTVRFISSTDARNVDLMKFPDTAPQEVAGAVTLDASGKRMAIALDNGFEIWDLTTKKRIQRFDGLANNPFVVSLASNGREIAVANTLRSWWHDFDLKDFRDQDAVMVWPLAEEGTPKSLKGFLEYTGLFRSSANQNMSSGGQLFNTHTNYLSTFLMGRMDKLGTPDQMADLTTRYIWNTSTGEEATALNQLVSLARSRPGRHLHFAEPSPDGKRVGMVFREDASPPGAKPRASFEMWAVGMDRAAWRAAVPTVDPISFDPEGHVVQVGTMRFNAVSGVSMSPTEESEASSDLYHYGTFVVNGKRLGAQISTGRVSLLDAETKSKICDLYWINKDDWAVITPSGLFDGTDGAQAAMHFEVSDPAFGYETISLEQLKSSYYVPGLLHKLLYKPQDIPKVGDLSITLPPTVNADVADSRLNIKAAPRGGGVGRLEVRVNGSEISSDARTGTAADTTIDLKDKLRAGDNKIEVIPWNAEGNVRGRPVATFLNMSADGLLSKGVPFNKPADQKKGGDVNFYAIISGVADYQGTGIDLRFAAKDAENMAQSLSLAARKYFCAEEMQASKPCERVHIRLMSTEANKDAQFGGLRDVPDIRRIDPVKQNYKDTFAEIASNAKPEDVVFVYMSGHGTAITSEQAVKESAFPDLYLYPTRDASTLDREVMSNAAEREAKTVSSLELATWLGSIKADKRVMVLDTCAAGAVQKDLTSQARAVDALQVRSIDRLRERSGFYILMGTAADSQSFEANEYRQGLLTYSLIQAMTTDKGLRDGHFLDVENWFTYAEDTVEDLARGIGGIQKPNFFKSSYAKTFDIGRLDSDEQRQLPLAQRVPLLLRPELRSMDLTDREHLSDLLETRLIEQSRVAGRGQGAPINYIRASAAANGLSPRGIYSVSGDVITVDIALIKDEEPVAQLKVSGKRDEIAAKLADALVAAAASRK